MSARWHWRLQHTASMAPSNSGSPAPLPDFRSPELPIETISAGTRLSRIHLAEFAPIHFGSKGINRFDDPRRIFGVCYMAMTQEGHLLEPVFTGSETDSFTDTIFGHDVSPQSR